MKLIKLEPFDWRYSAAIVGLVKYLKFYDFNFTLTEDYLEFYEDDISENNYLNFSEKFFSENMHHIYIEDNIKNIYLDEKKIHEHKKIINEKMNANTILKKLFSKIKYDGNNSIDILKTINENRMEIIKNTYKSGRSLYYNFCNENQMFNEVGKVCRIKGYSIDMGKKSKGNSYNFDAKTFIFSDSKYFDFIPFAFSKDREAFFINSNTDLNLLIEINRGEFEKNEKNTLRSQLLDNITLSSTKFAFDVEIILKDRNNEYFETLFIRKDALNILKKIKQIDKDIIKKPCHIGKSSSFSSTDYLPLEKIITNSILNYIFLDSLIEFLFKVKDKNYFIKALININRLIYCEEDSMSDIYKQTQFDAIGIKNKLPSNKLRTYEQKLISAISLKDYDKVKEILIHLSSFAQVPIRALIPLCVDFEKNKNLAYVFINSLGEKTFNKSNDGVDSNDK